MSSFAENVKAITEKIKRTADYAMQPTPSPVLIAVSKRQEPSQIDAAIAAGHRVFGENRVQEAESHWRERRDDLAGLELHLIGSLQSNKVKDAVALFDVIQTVDRKKLAKKLASEMKQQNRKLDVFIQVNTGDEPQKGGVPLDELADLIDYCRSLDMPPIGLMCIPPVSDDPALHFALLKKLAKRHGIEGLSMGMSSDFDLAALMGASHIRVGTALFGARKS